MGIFMRKNTKNTIVAIISIILIAAISVGGWLIYDNYGEKPNGSDSGIKTVTVKVRNTVTKQEEKVFIYKTNQNYLTGLLLETELASGEVLEYGFSIKTVDGVTLDETKNQYWAIYVNGNYGNYGADSQPIRDGDTFELVLETY